MPEQQSTRKAANGWEFNRHPGFDLSYQWKVKLRPLVTQLVSHAEWRSETVNRWPVRSSRSNVVAVALIRCNYRHLQRSGIAVGPVPELSEILRPTGGVTTLVLVISKVNKPMHANTSAASLAD